MVTKHFFKTLATFVAMIVLGLIGLFAASYFGKDGIQSPGMDNQNQVAK